MYENQAEQKIIEAPSLHLWFPGTMHLRITSPACFLQESLLICSFAQKINLLFRKIPSKNMTE